MEQNDQIGEQLANLANLVTDQRNEMMQRNEFVNERWAVNEARWDGQDTAIHKLHERISENHVDMTNTHAIIKDELVEEIRESTYTLSLQCAALLTSTCLTDHRQILDAIEQHQIAYEGTFREITEGKPCGRLLQYLRSNSPSSFAHRLREAQRRDPRGH